MTSKTGNTLTNHTIYYRALDADRAFQNALVAKYGNRAGDMRYRTGSLPADIRALALAFHAAADAWRATFREVR